MFVCHRSAFDQDAISPLDPLGAVAGTDGHRVDQPGHVRGRTKSPGHRSVLLGLRMAEKGARTLARAPGPAPRVRGRDEGDHQGRPPFRDCARMVHKMANVLDKLPKGSQPKAKRMLHDIYMAE